MQDHYYNYFPLAVSLLCIIISIPIAYFRNKKFKKENPECKSYMWGFFQGTAPIVSAVIMSIVYVIAISDMNSFKISNEISILMTIIFIRACIAWGVLRRNRWIFILHTVIGLNLIVWIINGFYIKNRWSEMAAPDIETPIVEVVE